ncbi:MAG: membrane protein insertion efficiency factor YidD [bacterium]
MVSLIVFIALPLSSVQADIQFILNQQRLDSISATSLTPFSFEEVNEVKIGALGLIRLYQLFLSSQDTPNCQFTPTCSRFTFAAIKRYGLLWGVIMGSDRLQRCHGFSRLYYPLHPETDKCYDPPEEEWLWLP